MKKLDSLIIRSFIPPFIMTFFVALFVLIMQFLWKYIDEIAGKGLEMQTVGELLAYKAVALFPLTLPIAVLISTVMVMGNLSEHYELSSFKSAGVSLWRVMLPMGVVTFLIASLSFFSSNNIIPVANLKFKTRLTDIRKQKPALSLDAGVFNDDFKGAMIYIKEKDAETNDLAGVMIYDHTNQKNNGSKIVANTGNMSSTQDGDYLIMNLGDGCQYQNMNTTTREDQLKRPLIRTKFKSWEKIFDLTQFDLQMSNEENYKNHYSMLSVPQLGVAHDSLGRVLDKYHRDYDNYLKSFFHFRKKAKDSIPYIKMPSYKFDTVLPEVTHFIDLFEPSEKAKLLDVAKSSARGIKGQAKSSARRVKSTTENKVKHANEWHLKFSLAVVCIVFLFIGAPLGAVIKKGGFGASILVAIVFFVMFIIFDMMGRDLSKSLAVTPAVGTWLPHFILIPIALFITHRAASDAQDLGLKEFWGRVKAVFKRVKK